MKKKLLLCLMAIAALAAPAKDIFVNTPNTTLLLATYENNALRICYYGDRIEKASYAYQAYCFSEEAYPAFGLGCDNVPALSVKHADGNMSTELVYVSDTQQNEGNSTLYTITMRDRVYDFTVDVCYRAYNNCDVIEMYSVIHNNEKKPVTLLKFASGFMPVWQGDVWVSHQAGDWGSESQIIEEPLNQGMFEIHDLGGTRNAFQNRPNLMLSLDGKPQENYGRVIGAVLCWSGNFSMSIDTRNNDIHCLVAGINEANSSYTLGKGESFTTPELAFTYSNEGAGGMSRSYHRWARLNNKVYNGTALRKTLVNSWEGVYLNVTQEGMEKMMDGAKQVGAELFVMDDGWFGNKYRRTVDDCALGDWGADKVKLPQGIPSLEKACLDRGLKWGIWIEPEMTNTKSELYEKHPDWVICHPTRKPLTGRGGTQLILDMSNPQVQDFVFKVVDDIMKETPNTYFIKWDHNFQIYNFGSHYLSADRQSHLYVDYQLGLIKTLKRIRAKYPNLVIQCCASGGGRVNYGLMPYFDEFWVSDNTDAQQRLFIQWGTSMYFPPCAMAQHVSASPNHQTGRIVPLKFRFDVAMTGRLGMEMKPSDLKEKEMQFAQNAFKLYKDTIRTLVQQGNQYRLISPYDGKGFASQMFVNDSKSEAVFFCYKFEHYINMLYPRFRFAGLDPDATYVLNEINSVGKRDEAWDGAEFTGRFLMNQGIDITLD
ncbi:MAG: alpha-galactosidase, partial [Bacteroidales bacterium]|nr:alpha-galactosidase [Candidatus Sodaliphilus aphodohippi]